MSRPVYAHLRCHPLKPELTTIRFLKLWHTHTPEQQKEMIREWVGSLQKISEQIDKEGK